MSATLRIRWSRPPFSLILRRESGEDSRELATRTNELIHTLARELPDFRIKHADYNNKLRNRIELQPPSRIFDHSVGTSYVWHEEVAIATSFAERNAVVQRMVSAIEESCPKLDWTGTLVWILDEFGAAVRGKQSHAFDARPHVGLRKTLDAYNAARDELLAPFYEGAYPVKRPELLYEFHHLDLAAQSAISMAYYACYSVSAGSFTGLTSEARARTVWPALAARLQATGWLMPGTKSWSQKVIDAPFMTRGPRARALGRYQAFGI